MATDNDIPNDYIPHAGSLENFRLALIEAEPSATAIDYHIAVAAWAALIYALCEIQAITAAADRRIEELQDELGLAYLKELPTAGTA